MNPAGSLWHKWDLHIHTPASFHWSGKKLHEHTPAEREQLCKEIADRFNALEVSAFCIMDYWTFDGYLALREYCGRNPTATTKRIFPGIELRLEAPTDYRLNTHVLFSDDVLPEALGHFLSHLKMGGPDGKPPSRQNFIEVAKSYDAGKLRIHGLLPADKTDDAKMLDLGVKTAVVTRESLQKAIEVVGKDKCLLVQPYDTNDGLDHLDWKCHPYTDSTLMKWADCFETRQQIHVDLFLGLGHPTKAHVGPEFIDNLGGYPKPVFSGSDAHKIAHYGVYPSERITWLKAQSSFQGLKQVCHEPALRCFIGKLPPKLAHVSQNSTKYMKHLAIEKLPGSSLDEHWFEHISIDLNPGLIAIIGNKGSGKSALADVLALAANSHCSEMEFLTASRFRGTGNKSKHFKATLTWADGTPIDVTLDKEPDQLQPERVRYLPQHFIEKLCNEIATGNETNFEKELKKVIFSHVPEDKRLQKATLDELLDYTVAAHKKAIYQLRGKLKTNNDEILQIEKEISDETLKSYRTALTLKESELEAHDKARPPAVEEPANDPDDTKAQETAKTIAQKQLEFDAIQTKVDAAKAERTALVAREALFTRLGGQVDNFEDTFKTFIEENKEEFESAGIKIEDIVNVTVKRDVLTTAADLVTKRLQELAVLVEGTDASKGLEVLASDCSNAIIALQDDLNAPQKLYQVYLAELNRWQTRRAEVVGAGDKPETIEYLKARILRAQTLLPTELVVLQEQRRQLVREIHKELLAIRNAHQELYKPVQQIATETEFAKESLQLQFDAFLTSHRFEENFLDFLHRNRKGTFYGEDESRKAIRDMLEPHDFNSTDAVVAFVDSLITALTGINRDGQRESVSIQSQLRANKKIGDLYNFIFGLDYLEPRYTLRLGGKDISQLSPGEKGALLLVFYLLLDREEIPIIIDQPEHNLDNESVVRLLVDCIRQAGSRRQVIIVTHNPNLAVVCDADQLICSSINKTDGHRIVYTTGAIEDHQINKTTVDVLEGTYPAFDNRRRKYHKPQPEIAGGAATDQSEGLAAREAAVSSFPQTESMPQAEAGN